MRALALIAISLTACAHATQAIPREIPQHKVKIQPTPTPRAATIIETPMVETARGRGVFVSVWSNRNWGCGTAQLPEMAPIEWAHDDETPLAPKVLKALGNITVSKVLGPPQLDAELVSAAPLIRNCYRAANAHDDATPSLLLTVLERTTLPLLIADVYPQDAPRDLVGCISRALIGELVNPLGAAGPMKIAATVAPPVPQ